MKAGVLIDNIVNNKSISDNMVLIGNSYYIARPKKEGTKWKLFTFYRRLGACWRVLMDKGLVVYYKEDE